MRNVTLPRMRPGLPATSAERCRALLLNVVGRALMEDDWEWVVRSPIFEAYCQLVGLSEEQVLQLRLRYCRNQFGPHRLWMSSLDAPRFKDKGSTVDDEVQWQSWPSIAR